MNQKQKVLFEIDENLYNHQEKTTLSSNELKSLIDAWDRLMCNLTHDKRLKLPIGALIAIKDLGKIIDNPKEQNHER